MDHILLKRAIRFEPGKQLNTEGWAYRKDIGAWVDADSPDVLMVTDEAVVPYGVRESPRPNGLGTRKPAPKPPRPKPRPMSKKADMETGEDMKGE